MSSNISDLPIDPLGNNNLNGNINMSVIANQNSNPNNMQNQMNNQNVVPNSTLNQSNNIDQLTINQIVNGIQSASLNGATSLPSRDIPMMENVINNDSYKNTDYIPESSKRNYINENNNETQIINNYNSNQQQKQKIDYYYEELQYPLLISLLYFIFQLPIVKKIITKYITFLINNDGNYNLNGLVFMSFLFGLVYYSINKIMEKFNKF